MVIGFFLTATLPSSSETGSLGIPHLKRVWYAATLAKIGHKTPRENEGYLDRLVFDALGVGLNQTLQTLFLERLTFEEFEAWVVKTGGEPDRFSIERLQALITGEPYSDALKNWLRSIENSEPVFSQEELSFWRENGYIVLKEAVTPTARRDAEAAIWHHVKASPVEPETWYQNDARHGIMVELIQHPALHTNRHAPRIHKAFSQLWGTADLWPSVDRCGFHPPQLPDHPFPGPDLHWDIDFSQPLVFGTQGILYLTDTPPEQGALTLVPGFHKELPSWLSSLPKDADPQQQDPHALGSIPVGGQAGDLVIWHHHLPHGSRPNLGRKPRIVQYINRLPNRRKR